MPVFAMAISAYHSMPKGSEMGQESVGAAEETGSDERSCGSQSFSKDAVHHECHLSLNTFRR